MGKLFVVSSGPGGAKYLTKEAQDAINESNLIVAYTRYARDLRELFGDKEVIVSGMTKEIERCTIAIERAKGGDSVSLISNGDVNVFAMATLAVEIIEEKGYWNDIDMISIPGVTSMFAAASLVGAPISQDFAIISLSDKLTDINVIDKRVNSSLESDFVIGIYNPMSKKRKQPYQNFLNSLQKLENSREAIIASNIGREDQEIVYTDTDELVQKGINNKDISMSTLIIVGNSSTKKISNNKLLTPRGYLKKYNIDGELR